MAARSPTAPRSTGVDGRSSRWDDHRRDRRHELVSSTLRAIRAHGADVGMDDVAAIAGTSKTVLYRHFTDRAGLAQAVADRVDRTVRRDLAVAVAANADPRDQLLAAIDAYLALVETDPEVYRFVLSRPTGGVVDPMSGLSGRVADQLTALLVARLRLDGLDAGAASPWADAVVGAVRSAADTWLRRPAAERMSRTDLTSHLTAALWTGLAPVLRDRSEEP